MGENTPIEWTKHSWNPWVGCFKVSPGCKNCYMYREQNQYGQNPKEIRRTKPGTFTKPVFWNEKDPGLVFTSSWTDFFLEEADPAWRADAWDVIRHTPNNTYQILTKRIDLAADMMPDDWGNGWSHVWLGTSIENQEMANKRVKDLLKIPAQVHFLSCEPLLSFIDLAEAGAVKWNGYKPAGRVTIGTRLGTFPEPLVDWVIVGGESGLAAHARPMHPYWAEDLLGQCKESGIPFFFKQWGQWAPYPLEHPDGHARLLSPDGTFGDVNWNPIREKHDFVMAPMGKKKAGNYLSGGYWQEFPKTDPDSQLKKRAAAEGVVLTTHNIGHYRNSE